MKYILNDIFKQNMFSQEKCSYAAMVITLLMKIMIKFVNYRLPPLL